MLLCKPQQLQGVSLEHLFQIQHLRMPARANSNIIQGTSQRWETLVGRAICDAHSRGPAEADKG